MPYIPIEHALLDIFLSVEHCIIMVFHTQRYYIIFVVAKEMVFINFFEQVNTSDVFHVSEPIWIAGMF